MSITKIALTLIIAFAMIGMAAAEKPGQPDAVKWTPPGGYQTYDNVTDAPLGPLADLYDRDNDGTLDLREIQIVYHDWLHLRLTLEEETAFIAILGEEPRFVGSLGSTTKPVEVCEKVYRIPGENRWVRIYNGYYEAKQREICGVNEGTLPDGARITVDTRRLWVYADGVTIAVLNDQMRRIRVSGDDNTITAQDVSRVCIAGDDNTIEVEDVNRVGVCGDDNTLAADTINRIQFCGDDNDVTADDVNKASECGEGNTINGEPIVD